MCSLTLLSTEAPPRALPAQAVTSQARAVVSGLQLCFAPGRGVRKSWRPMIAYAPFPRRPLLLISPGPGGSQGRRRNPGRARRGHLHTHLPASASCAVWALLTGANSSRRGHRRETGGRQRGPRSAGVLGTCQADFVSRLCTCRC